MTSFKALIKAKADYRLLTFFLDIVVVIPDNTYNLKSKIARWWYTP